MTSNNSKLDFSAHFKLNGIKDQLKNEILAGKLQDGDLISVTAIREQFDLNKEDALYISEDLTAEGLLKGRDRKKVFVIQLNSTEAVGFAAKRVKLEGSYLRSAAIKPSEMDTQGCRKLLRKFEEASDLGIKARRYEDILSTIYFNRMFDLRYTKIEKNIGDYSKYMQMLWLEESGSIDSHRELNHVLDLCDAVGIAGARDAIDEHLARTNRRIVEILISRESEIPPPASTPAPSRFA